ncbi:MAG: site-2 protease family protein [Spirochaetes bacterium]|nr:site-2 protease family protein [Spirochaetota bacterium]
MDEQSHLFRKLCAFNLLKRFISYLHAETAPLPPRSGSIPLPHQRKAPLWVHIFLFVATFITTTLAGSDGRLTKDALFTAGLPFSIALMIILLSHEMGHYLAARICGLKATLPFFIPMPHFLSLIGTLGAVIKIQSPIKSRRALLYVGMMGPLAGFCTSLVATIIGLRTSHIQPLPFIPPGSLALHFGDSILFRTLTYLFHGSIPQGHDVFLSPIAWAGWIGFFITALNLMPIGQLDGGHIVHALVGKNQRIVGWFAFAGLVILCFFWFYWVVWIFLILFFVRIGHPEIRDGLIASRKERFLGWCCMAIFILTFIPIPVTPIENDSLFPLSCKSCVHPLEPSGIALANKKVFIVNDENCTIYQLEFMNEQVHARSFVTLKNKFMCKNSDFEGISIWHNAVYIANEKKRQILKVDFSGSVEIVHHDIENYAKRNRIQFSHDENAGFEGIALDEDGKTLYILNERNPCVVFKLRKEENRYITTRHFIPKDRRGLPLSDASDLYCEHGYLYVLYRYNNSIVKYRATTGEFVSDFDFSSFAIQLYTSKKGHGFAEGLALSNDKIFLIFESNGIPLLNPTLGTHGVLGILPRPKNF